MEYEFIIENELHKVSIEKKGETFVISLGEELIEAEIIKVSPHIITLLINGKSYTLYYAQEKDKRYISLGGQECIVQEPSEHQEAFRGTEERREEDKLMIKAPMPGKVIKINVSEKEEVRKNQTLAIVEAMKMENEIKSSIDGYIKTIFVSPGDLVDSESPLIELELKE
ncbi:MAG: biotin/lipoyl-containing protein [Candidatus Aminicenantales bacterium]